MIYDDSRSPGLSRPGLRFSKLVLPKLVLSNWFYQKNKTYDFREVAVAVKKRKSREELFLNAVARKLGNAAGKLTRASKDLAESISALPEKATARVKKVADAEIPAKRRSASTRQQKKRARSTGVRGTSRPAAKKQKARRSTATARGRHS
jgi:hypothetical protein